MAYTRFRRRKLAKVRLEFALTCLGLNIRKFLKFKKVASCRPTGKFRKV
ncbi:transposase [Parasutterella excrementihominis]